METCSNCRRPFGSQAVITPDADDLVCESCFAKKFPQKRPMGLENRNPHMALANGQLTSHPSAVLSDIRRKTARRNILALINL